jgi:hypothetical protein
LLTGADPTASASEATPLRRAAKQKTLFIIDSEYEQRCARIMGCGNMDTVL